MKSFFKEYFAEIFVFCFLTVVFLTYYISVVEILDNMNRQSVQIRNVEKIVEIVPEMQKDIVEIKKIVMGKDK